MDLFKQNLILLFFISFLVTFLIIPFFINIAFKFNIVDKPDGNLKKHKKITPYLGGISIFLGLTITSFIALQFKMFQLHLPFFLFLIGIFLLLVLGLIDDIYVLKPIHKIFGQTIVAIFFILSGFVFNLFSIQCFNIFLSIFWYLTIMNAFNLVDVMDGLATTLSISCCSSFIIFSLFMNNLNLGLFMVQLLGSLLAFLMFNRPIAQIYLGDSGSLFLGGFFSVIPFLLFNPNVMTDFHYFLIAFLILFIPIFELVSLIMIRSYKGIPFYLGSPDHFSIILQNKNWSKQKILYYVVLGNLFLLVSAISILFHELWLLIFFGTFIISWIINIYK